MLQNALIQSLSCFFTRNSMIRIRRLWCCVCFGWTFFNCFLELLFIHSQLVYSGLIREKKNEILLEWSRNASNVSVKSHFHSLVKSNKTEPSNSYLPPPRPRPPSTELPIVIHPPEEGYLPPFELEELPPPPEPPQGYLPPENVRKTSSKWICINAAKFLFFMKLIFLDTR